jgi:hypothetical protein
MSFDEIAARWDCRPIANCPGRFVLRNADPRTVPQAVAGDGVPFEEFHVAQARDVVVVARFDGGGLISYRRADGSYLHTVNTVEGLERKLAQLGIRM